MHTPTFAVAAFAAIVAAAPYPINSREEQTKQNLLQTYDKQGQWTQPGGYAQQGQWNQPGGFLQQGQWGQRGGYGQQGRWSGNAQANWGANRGQFGEQGWRGQQGQWNGQGGYGGQGGFHGQADFGGQGGANWGGQGGATVSGTFQLQFDNNKDVFGQDCQIGQLTPYNTKATQIAFPSNIDLDVDIDTIQCQAFSDAGGNNAIGNIFTSQQPCDLGDQPVQVGAVLCTVN